MDPQQGYLGLATCILFLHPIPFKLITSITYLIDMSILTTNNVSFYFPLLFFFFAPLTWINSHFLTSAVISLLYTQPHHLKR